MADGFTYGGIIALIVAVLFLSLQRERGRKASGSSVQKTPEEKQKTGRGLFVFWQPEH